MKGCRDDAARCYCRCLYHSRMSSHSFETFKCFSLCMSVSVSEILPRKRQLGQLRRPSKHHYLKTLKMGPLQGLNQPPGTNRPFLCLGEERKKEIWPEASLLLLSGPCKGSRDRGRERGGRETEGDRGSGGDQDAA